MLSFLISSRGSAPSGAASAFAALARRTRLSHRDASRATHPCYDHGLTTAHRSTHRTLATRRLPSSLSRWSPSSFSSFRTATTSASSSSIQRTITLEERAQMRAARKERATRVLHQQQAAQGVDGGMSGAGVAKEGVAASSIRSGSGAGSSTTASTSSPSSLAMSRWIWYLGLGIPTGLLVWGIGDDTSPPARFSKFIGLTGLIHGYADHLARPSFDKLLPDWSQMPNVPHDIPVPPTLVLDLENTLVSSTWDRKYGWRHAKRPGVDKFLHELAQYYEIVLYSPSIDGVADPVVTSLDKDGCILHRLYRDATYYTNGVHVKDLRRLNRNLKRMIVLDDDPAEVQFNPENVITIKPYTDPTDRTDNSLLRILPFLVEIAREGYNDIPALLSQYRGMDADQIADEQERRVSELRQHQLRRAQQGLSGLARGGARAGLPAPELPAESDTNAYYRSSAVSQTQQLTAKDIAGKAPDLLDENSDGFVGWMKRRAKEKEEHQMRKLEKWNEVMIKKQRQKHEETERSAA